MLCCRFPSALQFGAHDLGFFFPGKRWGTDESGHRRPKLEERSLKREDRRQVMSREQSDGEDSAGETRTDRFVDATVEMEVELRLPLEVDVEPAQIRKDVPINSGAVNMDAVDPDPETQR